MSEQSTAERTAAAEAQEAATAARPDANCPSGLNAAIRITHDGYNDTGVNYGFKPHYTDAMIRELYRDPQATADAIPSQYAGLVAEAQQIESAGGTMPTSVDLLAPAAPVPAPQTIALPQANQPTGSPATAHVALPTEHASWIVTELEKIEAIPAELVAHIKALFGHAA